MEFKEKVVIVTGSGHGIGKCIKELFINEGAYVCGFDLYNEDYFLGNLAYKKDIERFVHKVLSEYGRVDYIINNAKPAFKGIDTCSYEEFVEALKVGSVAPYYLVKLCKDYMPEGSVIINISSTRDHMSQPQSESYSAAKGAIFALTHSLAASLKGKIRVNSISPGWINTSDDALSNQDIQQHLTHTVGKAEDIGNMVLYLCSKKASFINGENITIDGGMSKQMIYHGENGWRYEDE